MTTTCGTIAGYTRHRRKKESTCIECKLAWRDYYRELRQRKKEELSKNDTLINRNSRPSFGVLVNGDGSINWDLVQ